MNFLVPGVGAQEGSLRDCVLAGLRPTGDGIIINASRSIIYASQGSDYGIAARSATVQLREQINRYRDGREGRLPEA
jgi:orotidine-5'-phosphate decarboxylase